VRSKQKNRPKALNVKRPAGRKGYPLARKCADGGGQPVAEGGGEIERLEERGVVDGVRAVKHHKEKDRVFSTITPTGKGDTRKGGVVGGEPGGAHSKVKGGGVINFYLPDEKLRK